MNDSQKQPHIDCAPGDITPIVLLPGNPQRVDVIAKYLDDAKEVAYNREFHTVTGTYKGIQITITSTGIGCSSTAIAVEELIACGAQTLIRVGTCGGAWREDIQPLSVIVPTASIRDEGTTIEYIPQGFPAVANVEIVQALMRSAKACNVSAYSGINRTHDSFYAPDASAAKWGAFYQDARFKNTPSPILSSEMESAALFVIASLQDVRAGAIFAVDANPTPLKNMALRTEYLPNVAFTSKELSAQAQANAITTALEALQYLV